MSSIQSVCASFLAIFYLGIVAGSATQIITGTDMGLNPWVAKILAISFLVAVVLGALGVFG